MFLQDRLLFAYSNSARAVGKGDLYAISVCVISRIGVDDDPVIVLVFLLGVNGKPVRLDLFGIRLDLIDIDGLKSGGKFIFVCRSAGKFETGLRNKPGEFVIRPVAAELGGLTVLSLHRPCAVGALNENSSVLILHGHAAVGSERNV